MIKKILKALTKTLLVLFLSGAFLLAILQNSYVQSYLAKSGSLILSEQLGVSIWIEKIRVRGFFNLSLSNVYLQDHHKEAMITAKNINIDMPLIQGITNNIPINSIEIDSAYVRLKKYKGEDNINITAAFTSNNETTEIIQDSSEPKIFKLSLKHLLVKNTHFIYEDANRTEIPEFGMDYQGLDVEHIDLEMNDVQVFGDSILSSIIHLSAREKSGIHLKHLEGLANVSSKGTFIENANVQTDRSNIYLDLGFNYQHWSAYLDFINEVYIDSDIKNSKLNLDDISFFAPQMKGMDNLIRLEGNVKGAVRNLKATDLDFSIGKSTSFKGNIQLTGLPNIYESFINLKIKVLSTNIKDIKAFKLPKGEQLSVIPSEIEKFGNIRIKGRYTGFYNDFVSNADIYTELGKLYTNIQFQNNQEEGILYYNGDFEARDFEFGKFIEKEDDFGKINFDLAVDGKGLSLETIETNVNGRIDSLEFRNNPINTIFVDALIKEKKFKGTVNLKDNLINADFLGLIDFEAEKPLFDFTLDLEEAKLAELKLLEIDSSASLSTHINLNFTGNRLDDFDGRIFIDSTQFYYIDKKYDLDSIHLYSNKYSDSNINDQIRINADFIEGKIFGKYSLENLASSFELLTQQYLGNLEFIENDTVDLTNEAFNLEFKLFNSDILTELFVPNLKLNDTLYLDGHYFNNAKNLSLGVETKSIALNEMLFNGFNFNVQTNPESANSQIDIEQFIFKKGTDTDTLELGVENVKLDFKFYENKGDFNINWSNKSSIPVNNGNIIGRANVIDNTNYRFDIEAFDVVINDTSWNIAYPSFIQIDTSSIVFDSIQFLSKNSSVLLDGAFAESMQHPFKAHFNNFNIEAFNLLLLSSGISLGGSLTGDFQLIDAYRSAGFLTDMNLQDFVLNGEALGDADIKSTWNSDQSIFLNLSLAKQGNKGEYKPLYLEGYYYPYYQDNQMDVDISLHNLSINFLNPFLKSFVSDLEGNATGEIRLTGSLNKPDLKGQLDLARTQFRIKYLNTLYSLSGPLFLDNESLGFDQVSIYDTVGNVAQLSGGLTHTRLKNFGVDLKVSPNNFVALNTNKGMNELFYGKAVVSGDLLIKGPFDNVFLDINASSKRGTDLKIPINTTLGVSENSFIIFVNDDSISEQNSNSFVPQLSNFSLNMDLNITPDAKVEISLPAQLGEIQATGFGDLNMNLSRTGNFRMSGDYRVSDGLFYFRIRNLLNRRFDLREGGTISWTGDPYSGELGMSATYQLKTSLNSLGLEQDSSYRNRVPVECIIGLTGPIMDPNIKFQFDLPNATEEVKQYVYTKIDTTNPSEMSQQMLSLLVFNSFSFNNGTGNNSLANSVTGSSMQIVANQLSNWLSQISKDVDIGINYRPGSDLTNEEVEVALSTQLFDERVTIDGNFGYQNVQDNPNTSASSIVGDINVEVKLTNDGRLRLKAFNRTNTVDLLDNTSPYTQGVGIFYRKEFNNVKELFTNQRKQEREKRKAELEKSKARANEEEDLEEKSIN